MRTPLPKIGLAALVVLAACTRPDADTAPAPANTITREQIESLHVTNAYEAVVRLRSNWLRSNTFNAPVLAYIDDVRFGDVDRLREVPIDDVEYIRYFTATAASARWGVGHAGGVVMVSTDPLEP